MLYLKSILTSVGSIIWREIYHTMDYSNDTIVTNPPSDSLLSPLNPLVRNFDTTISKIVLTLNPLSLNENKLHRGNV